MPLQKLQFRPGVNREGTTLANEGGWYDCDKIRFRSGYPEKIGGWAALSYNTFLGVCRSLWNWVTLKQYNLMGVGTNLKFYVEDGGEYYDITPIRETNGNTASAGPPVVNLSTIVLTASGTVLTVSDSAADTLQVNDFVTIAGANTIGGVDVNGEYQIATVISGTSYTVTLATATTGTASNAAITIAYQINTGFATYTIGTGWGAGPWPLYSTLTLTNPFTASGTGVSVLTVTTPNPHDLTTGNSVFFASISSNACGINRLALQKAFQVTVTGANTFTISTVIGIAPGPVITYTTSSTAASGGAVTMYVPTPLPTTANNVRNWGSGFTTGFNLQLRLWSQANFGERLLFSPRGSALYVWDPGSGATPAYNTRGTVVTGTDVPSKINQIMVSDTSRITIAFGCNDYGAYDTTPIDPLLIRWSEQESYTGWTPAATNQAGSYRLSHGSEIVGALQTRQEIVVWTDASIYAMQYLGPPLVYGFTLLADNVSLIAPNAMATASGAVYWMGVDKFYMYSGRVETLPCSVRQFIFNDINRDQEAQFNAGTNEGYSEVWWNYCSKKSDVIDRYVIFNYLDRVWYYGTLDRTAWLDSPLRPYPMAATAGNIVVYHEAAVDNGSTNPPTPINAYIQSSDFDISDGHNYGFVWRMIPDITFDGSDTTGQTSDKPYVQFTVRPKQNPGSNYGATLPRQVTSAQSYAGETTYNVQQFTEIIYSRVRGRQMAFKIESNSIGTQWQLGVPRIDVRPDGRN
jgi:hypothetical protein